MPGFRPVLARSGAVLAAATLAMAGCLPAGAVTSARWPLVFQAHYGTPTLYNGLLGVAAAGKTAAWAVGGTDLSAGPSGGPLAEQWNGTSWQAPTLPAGLTGPLIAVSAPGATDAWAVSQLTGYLLRWNGTAWSVARTWHEPKQLPRELTGVTAFSPTDVWVFGGPGAYPGVGTWHLAGSTWHKVTGLADGISSASALSPANMWAIGSTTAPGDILLHYHGTTWRKVTSPALSGLQFTRILALSAHSVWAIGSVGGGPSQKLVHFDGSQWSTVPVTGPRSVNLVSMAPDGRGGVWFSGFRKSASWVLHRSAAGTWSSTKLTTNGAVYQLTRIPGTRSLWAAGITGTATGSDAAVWGHGPAT